MSDSYQLWRVEAPRHRDLTFVLFHRHNEGGTCSLSSIFKDVGNAMTLSEGYYTNQRVLRDACHVYHRLHLARLMWACRQSKGSGIEGKGNMQWTVLLFQVLSLFTFQTSVNLSNIIWENLECPVVFVLLFVIFMLLYSHEITVKYIYSAYKRTKKA